MAAVLCAALRDRIRSAAYYALLRPHATVNCVYPTVYAGSCSRYLGLLAGVTITSRQLQTFLVEEALWHLEEASRGPRHGPAPSLHALDRELVAWSRRPSPS